MKNVAHLLAEKLLKINALKLQPANPFVWASGWNSPIYTDNRRTLSYPDVRSFIKIELTRMIMENFPEAEAIAGVATGAIAKARSWPTCSIFHTSMCARRPKTTVLRT